MKIKMCAVYLVLTVSLALLQTSAGQAVDTVEVLSREDIDKLLPDSVFLDGENAPVQRRNAVGARLEDGKILLVTLLDTAGFASEYQQKYVGMVLAQGDLLLGQSEVGPGAYGLGQRKTVLEGEESSTFILYDLGGTIRAEVPAEKDAELRPVLTIQLKGEAGGELRLYLGRYYVGVSSR